MTDSIPQPVHETYARRVKARLAKPTITVEDARDGLLDCYIATYFEGVNQGLRGMLDIEGGADQIVRVTENLFRRKIREHGGTFDDPDLELLTEIKDEVDDELHFQELPAELKGLHDQVCTLLLSKAGGDLPHIGDRSAVNEPDPPPASAPTDPIDDSLQTQPTRVLPAEREPPPRGAPRPGTTSSVPSGLRGVLATYLGEFRDAVIAGAGPDALAQHLERTGKLIDTLQAFESER